MYGISIREVLCMSYCELDNLFKKYNKRKISLERFLFATNSPMESIPYICGRMVKKTIRKIKKTGGQ